MEVHTTSESESAVMLEQAAPPTDKPAYALGFWNPLPTIVMEAGEFSGQ